MEMKSETLQSNAETDVLISRPLLEAFREWWIGGTGVALDDPRVNLLHADLSGLPPIMIYYGGHEMLAGEAIAFATRAKTMASMSHCARCLKVSTTSSWVPVGCRRWTELSERSAHGWDPSSDA